MIDSHCHLEFEDFDPDREEVISKAKERIRAIVNSCADIKNSGQVLTLHQENPDFIFPSLGLHPTRALKASDKEIEGYHETIERNREEIVAVGEAGLDYFHVKNESKQEKNRDIFFDFVKLSNRLNLPLVVHSRNSMSDTLEILEKKDGKVIVHCFSGDLNDLKESVDRGYYLSFGGIIFRSEGKYRKLIEKIPLENLLLETDAPFLSKSKKNRAEPWLIKEVAEKIAKIKGKDFSEVWNTAGKNAKKVFDLPIRI